ncbi:MAG: alpha/beta hydrolase [Flavobacteriaceae bacterium]|nr:alpha/beta hydrolase [Flavobacteriaceae bacterium]
MKKTVLIILFLTTLVNAQEYSTKENIHYYNDSINKSESYINERCVLDIYYPKNQQNFATIVWFHGGGLIGDQKELPEYLKNKGFCVVGVNYRLSPKAKSPTYVQDAAAAIGWVFKNIASYGGDASKIFISGHSAGGYLTFMIGLDKRWLGDHNIDANKIAGLLPISGQTVTHSTIREEKGIPITQTVADDMAPLFHVRKDVPPMLLITGDRNLELPGRYEENALFASKMQEVGTSVKLFELQGYTHMVVEPALPLVVEEIKKILKEKEAVKTSK